MATSTSTAGGSDFNSAGAKIIQAATAAKHAVNKRNLHAMSHNPNMAKPNYDLKNLNQDFETLRTIFKTADEGGSSDIDPNLALDVRNALRYIGRLMKAGQLKGDFGRRKPAELAQNMLILQCHLRLYYERKTGVLVAGGEESDSS